MDNCAPILISVLDRDVHFRNCVISLAQNRLSDKTHLFIALDAPSAEKHIAGYNRILSFIESIKGFKEVTLFKREKNMGSSPNQFLAMEDVFKQYDRLIFTEDDNIFSPNFLDFVNQGLELFKDRKDIFSVSGHNYLIDIHKSYTSNYYIWTGFDAWGVGLWKEKWNQVDFSIENNKRNAMTLKNIFKLNSIAGHYVPALFQLVQQGVLHDDFAICLHLMKNNMFSVFPIESKVRNNGLDGSGENGGLSEYYKDQKIDDSNSIHLKIDDGSKTNSIIFKVLKKHFQLKTKSKIKLLLRYLNYLVTFSK